MQKHYQRFGDNWFAVIPPKSFVVTFTTVQPVKGKSNLLDVTCQEWRLNLN